MGSLQQINCLSYTSGFTIRGGNKVKSLSKALWIQSISPFDKPRSVERSRPEVFSLSLLPFLSFCFFSFFFLMAVCVPESYRIWSWILQDLTIQLLSRKLSFAKIITFHNCWFASNNQRYDPQIYPQTTSEKRKAEKKQTFLGENTPMVPPSSLSATPISARTASRSFLIASVFRSFDSHDSFSSAISFSLSFSRSMASSPPSIVTEDLRDLDFSCRSCRSWRFTVDWQSKPGLHQFSWEEVFFFFLVMFYSSFCATYSNIVIVLIIN